MVPELVAGRHEAPSGVRCVGELRTGDEERRPDVACLQNPYEAVGQRVRGTVVKRERDPPLGRLDAVDEGAEQLDAACSRELSEPGHANEEDREPGTDPDGQRADVHCRR